MKKFLSLFLSVFVFIGTPFIEPHFDSAGNLVGVIIAIEDTSAGVVSVYVTNQDADLTLDGTGNIANKAAFKTVAKAKLKAKRLEILALMEKAALDETRREKIILPVSSEDLEN